MNDRKESLKKLVEEKLSQIDSMLMMVKDKFSDEEYRNAKAIRDRIVSLMEQGKYNEASTLADQLMEKLAERLKVQQEISLPLVIGLLLVSGGIAAYFYQDELAKVFGKSKKKEKKKLRKFEMPGDESK